MRSLLTLALLASIAAASNPVPPISLGPNDTEVITDVSELDFADHLAADLASRSLSPRATTDRPNERCDTFCSPETGGCADPNGRCFLSGTLSSPRTPVYTFASGVGFRECAKECRRAYNCYSFGWKNGACVLYPAVLDFMGFTAGTTSNQETLYSNTECIDMKGQCLPHSSSFETALSPQGVAHPWNTYDMGSSKAGLAYVSNSQVPTWKPAPTGTHFLKITLWSKSTTATLEQIIRLDNENYVLSYNFLYNGWKLLSGNTPKPAYVNVVTTWCGQTLDRFAPVLQGPGNEGWKNRQVRVTVTPCAYPYSPFGFQVLGNDGPAGDYQVNIGFDDIQLIP